MAVPASETEEVEAKSDFFQSQQSGSPPPAPDACIAIIIITIRIVIQILVILKHDAKLDLHWVPLLECDYYHLHLMQHCGQNLVETGRV